ncbi:hypothetical protein ZWY2020_008400 [Hordeum vulgare]|nr:hypothetical protein ZWY2020_008400 [Hordeum vulgare]
MDPGGGATAIRVPYLHIRDVETELVRLNGLDNPRRRRASGHEGGAQSRIIDVSEQILRLDENLKQSFMVMIRAGFAPIQMGVLHSM